MKHPLCIFLLSFYATFVENHGWAQKSGYPSGISPDAIGHTLNSVVTIHTFTQEGGHRGARVGSGFFYNDRFVFTRRSVVEGADSIVIVLPDGRSVPSELVYCDGVSEIAVLKHSLDRVTPIRYGESQCLTPNTTVAILGNSLGVFPSVTLGRFIRHRKDGLLELESLIPPGNCGSPVFSPSGTIVGMVVGNCCDSLKSKQSTVLAIPSEQFLEVAKSIDKMRSQKGWIGISVVNLENGEEGVRVVEVMQGGPAHKANIMIGDTLLYFEGERIRNAQELAKRVREIQPHTTVSFIRKNRGEKSLCKVEVGALPLTTP